MRLHKIYGVFLRYVYLFKHSFDRLSDAFYWPTIDLVVWGLTSAYLKSLIDDSIPVVMLIVSGIIFWYVIWRAQYELTVNLLEEMWDKNLINTFVSPIKFSEWVTSLLVLGGIKAFISLIFTASIAYLLYKVQIFTLGMYLIPFMALLIMNGWAVGFFVTGIIFRYGSRIQTLAWAMVALISPFCAIYYPVSSLPQWAQYVATVIPASYVFEGMRQVLATGTLNINYLYLSLILNIIYIVLSLVYLNRSFKTLLNRGLINTN